MKKCNFGIETFFIDCLELFYLNFSRRNILNEDFGYLSIKNPKRNVNVNTLPSYIKLFEPNVIQSLRVNIYLFKF